MKYPRCNKEMKDMGNLTARTPSMPTYLKMRQWACYGCGFEMEERIW